MRASYVALALALVACAAPNPETPGDGGAPPDAAVNNCNAYEHGGATYDCSQLDRCTEENIEYRLACCECDAAYCEIDPNCPGDPAPVEAAETCMACHNGSTANDYRGTGLENPHPFTGAAYLKCTQCHGGDPAGDGKLGSHVPPPPAIGDRTKQALDPQAYFNRLTLTGLDKLGTYEVNGKTYTGLDYLQFVNPGDLRVVATGKSCGTAGCHGGAHAAWVQTSPIATQTGFYSGAMYHAGVENSIPEHRGLYQDTAAEYGFRALVDPDFNAKTAPFGSVGKLNEFPEKAVWGDTNGVFGNPLYDANLLANNVFTAAQDPAKTNRIIANTPLATLFSEQVAITCGDCHLGSAGANNRYADFRSSGCTACHMEYSPDGRSRSKDPNVNKLEPANPDAIAAPERPHIDRHQIRNVAKVVNGGAFQRGVSDRACAGCHQGSNRTVLQYWGIRLDQNQDVVNGTQYPANPVRFTTTAQDTRLYDPAVGNNTFNGRNANQYLLFEDYDGDNRDDTPPDVHYEAGLGCIDCHGERDLHNGAKGDPTSGAIASRQDQVVAIQCESCHGGIEAYAQTKPCVTYAGETANCATDTKGNVLRHVTRDAEGNTWLLGRVDGKRHYVPQTRDTVYNNNKRNPLTNELLYSAKASYAMGRVDGNAANGLGPVQQNPNLASQGFSHTDDMACATCHSAWTNNCTGCHLKNQYDANPNNYYFSNTTGERIVLFQANADFVYQSPLGFTLGVNSRGKIAGITPGETFFYRYEDLNGVESKVFAFSDRHGNGNNPNVAGRGAFGAMTHNQMMAHSIRGKVAADKEGPRYCTSCHLTTTGLQTFGAAYDAFRTAMATNNFGALDFALLQQHFGQNTGNQLGSPLWVHMVAGLGTGLQLFDATGCPTNPLDTNANRQYCPDGAPAANFDPARVVYNLDRIVEATGVTNASNGHPMLDNKPSPLRTGATDPAVAGPLGAPLIAKLADPNNGLVLDSWLDADGAPQGAAAGFVATANSAAYAAPVEKSGGCATSNDTGWLAIVLAIAVLAGRRRGRR